MQANPVKPIFVVGSPRSGTSVLAWCLGQHPNIFPVPESNWMGDFAVDVAESYRVGAARGNLSILSAMDITPVVFFANFGESINELILAHRRALEQKRKLDLSSKRKHAALGPKARWVDGTPEYSFHICGLRKLFPTAVFIHLVRDVDSVVRSLLNFHRVSGAHLVANEEEAYSYWLRTVKACLKAEQAYGPHVVHRVLYSTLVNKSESAIQSLLSFVGEPYSPTCLDPLGERINSSNVPPDFKSDDPATDPAIVEEARRLWIEIKGTPQPNEPSAAAADELEIEFQKLCLGTGKIEHELRNQMARQEQHYKDQLTPRLREMQQLVAMLDAVATIGENLRSSRFWRFANRAAGIEAKLFCNKGFAPDQRLQKLIRNYSQWRASHPDIANLDAPIHRAESPVSVDNSDTQVEHSTPGSAKVSKNSAKM
jgi:sulfotransferase family protein